MKFRSALLAATILALPLAAKAQPVQGLYVGAGAGVNFLENQTLKSITVGPGVVLPIGSTHNGNIEYHPGFVGLASIGWGFGNGLRVELEGDYRNNAIHKVSAFGNGLASVTSGGNEQKYGPMINAFYDFGAYTPPWIVPYVGFGVGYQWSAWQSVAVYGASFGKPSVSYQVNSDNTQGSFAFQPILGAAFPIPAVPGLSVTAEFRYMDLVGNRNYKGGAFVGKASTAAVIGTSGDSNFSGLVGLRYAFGVKPPPPPAPVVAPAPAPARSYLVFFDWDKYNLTDRAKQIIAEAAANIPKVQHTRIEVNGYTDTTGTAKYNMALSIRRANAVAAELVRLGVAKSDIAIQGFGDTHLLVPTGPQVREPQNRRVEIIIK
jgi:hypothetical protein